MNSSYKNIKVWKDDGWKNVQKNKFIKEYSSILKRKFTLIKATNTYEVVGGGFNYYDIDHITNSQYYDNCGNSKIWINPVFSVVSNRSIKQEFIDQDNFEFLRTTDGYKLISVTIR